MNRKISFRIILFFIFYIMHIKNSSSQEILIKKRVEKFIGKGYFIFRLPNTSMSKQISNRQYNYVTYYYYFTSARKIVRTFEDLGLYPSPFVLKYENLKENSDGFLSSEQYKNQVLKEGNNKYEKQVCGTFSPHFLEMTNEEKMKLLDSLAEDTKRKKELEKK